MKTTLKLALAGALLLGLVARAGAEDKNPVECKEVSPGLVQIVTPFSTNVVRVSRIIAIRAASFEGEAYWNQVDCSFRPYTVANTPRGFGFDNFVRVHGVSAIVLSLEGSGQSAASAADRVLNVIIPATAREISEALAQVASSSKSGAQ